MTTYKTNQDVYQQITNRIIAAIEAGAPKFEMPWHKGANQSRPINVLTKKPYQGINTLALWIAQTANDYTTGTWGTYRQWQTCGAQVKKGEHASIIVFFKDLAKSVEKPDETESNSRRSFIATSSSVFNADQVEGYSDLDSLEIDKTQILEQVEAFIRATEAKLIESGTIACYNPINDTIFMPNRAFFKDSSTSSATEGYYSTLLHELTHWTGHKNRLNRDLLNRFGNVAYAMEELVAELGAAFLCSDLGISLKPRPNHAAYLGSWLEVMKSDKRAIFTAASKATQATNYLFGLQA